MLWKVIVCDLVVVCIIDLSLISALTWLIRWRRLEILLLFLLLWIYWDWCWLWIVEFWGYFYVLKYKIVWNCVLNYLSDGNSIVFWATRCCFVRGFGDWCKISLCLIYLCVWVKMMCSVCVECWVGCLLVFWMSCICLGCVWIWL